ncbi:MAG: S-methyl-5'-thioadenosine phosphorylase [Syntrophomonadaceae bacterium]|nr:S-methyl-5'-thioadenosine phosphorylase [Syntrophomonadaceae bacterium]
MPRIGLIGGTGIYTPQLMENALERVESTPYGDAKVMIGNSEGVEVAFITRHGSKHSLPPHLVNYRANIMALKQLGVELIIATAAVGSLHLDRRPGEYVLADQFLDFTKTRKTTFFDGGEQGVTHCDMTIPYCTYVRSAIEKAGHAIGLKIHNGGTYVCTEGPRFETAAEINMFKMLGGNLVGMTSVPEVCLARELGICYGNISIVTNHAAGIAPHILTHAEVIEVMKNSMNDVRYLMKESLKYLSGPRDCVCSSIGQQGGARLS